MEKVETLHVEMSGKFQLEFAAFPFKLDGEVELPDTSHGTFESLGDQWEFLRHGGEDYVAFPGYGFELDSDNDSGGGGCFWKF